LGKVGSACSSTSLKRKPTKIPLRTNQPPRHSG
jgi:hypothetical protein